MNKVEKATIDSIPYKIYNLSFTAGNADAPSSIEVSFLEEANNYWLLPSLSLTTPVSIVFGPYTYNYYLVSRELEESPSGGNVLKCRFIDQSFILDQIWVGLKNKHGSSSQFPIMIVGDEISPCEDNFVDPCDPCPAPEEIDCEKLKEIKILEVKYSFFDLISAMQGFGINVTAPGYFSLDESKEYKQTYTGPLRTVLSNWVNDFGMTFYWNESNEIKFVELKYGITINDSVVSSDEGVTRLTTSESLEGTTNNGFIAHFAQDRTVLEYNCDKNEKVLMIPLQLDNIIKKDLWDNNYGLDISKFETACYLSMYSLHLRNLFLWKEYGLLTLATAKNRIGTGLLKPIGITINKVIGKTEDAKLYYKILDYFNMYKSEQGGVAKPVDPRLIKFVSQGGYFLLVEYLEDQMNFYHGIEKGLAETFIGKYYLRAFGLRAEDASWATPDGDSVQYVRTNSVLDAPFVQYINNYAHVAQAFGSSPGVAAANNANWNAAVPNTPFKFSSNNEKQTASNYLILERDSPWLPSLGDEKVAEVLGDLEKINFEDIPIPDFVVNDDLVGKKNLKLLMVFPLSFSGLSFTISTEKNSLDAGKLNQIYRPTGKTFVHYGLRDNRAKSVTIKTSNLTGGSLKIVGPSQGYIAAARVHGGYFAIANYNRVFKAFLDKLEHVSQKVLFSSQSRNVLATNIEVREIKEELSKIIERNIDYKCILNEKKIELLIEKYLNKLSFVADRPVITKTYELDRIPSQVISMDDGLESFSVSYGSSGVTSSLRFSNNKPRPKSQDLTIKEFEQLMDRFLSGRKYINNTNDLDVYISAQDSTQEPFVP